MPGGIRVGLVAMGRLEDDDLPGSPHAVILARTAGAVSLAPTAGAVSLARTAGAVSPKDQPEAMGGLGHRDPGVIAVATNSDTLPCRGAPDRENSAFRAR